MRPSLSNGTQAHLDTAAAHSVNAAERPNRHAERSNRHAAVCRSRYGRVEVRCVDSVEV